MVTEPFHFLLEKEGFTFIGSSVEAAPAYPFTVAVVKKDGGRGTSALRDSSAR
jgi:hypothetical protein